MNLRTFLVLVSCLFSSFGAPRFSSGAVPTNPVPAWLGELKKQHDAAATSLDNVAAVVDAEEKAQRLKPEIAQAERRTISELRGRLDVLTSSSHPVTEAYAGPAAPALSRAWQTFSDGVADRHAARVKANERARDDIVRYAVALWQSAEKPDSLAPAIEALRSVLKERATAPPSPGETSPDSVLRLLVSSQHFIESLEREDARAISNATTAMNPASLRGDPAVSATEVEQWIGRFATRAAGELKAANRAADELAVRKSSADEMLAAADKIDAAMRKLRALAGDRSMTSWDRSNLEPNVYRPWASLMKVVEEEQWSLAEELEGKLQLSPERLSAAALKVMVDRRMEIRQHKTKMEAEAGASEAEAMRKRLAAVSDAASALKLADEIRAERISRPANAARVNLLENELRQIATLWSSEGVTMPMNRLPDIETTTAWSADLAALRTRAFRDSLAKTLQAPELLRAPLSGLPPEQAVRQLAREHFAKAEWLRLHTLLSTAGAIFARAGLSDGDEVRAIKSYLTGQNMERAEQFTEAAAAYRSVLSCIGELVPVDAAADRLKALKREHPESLNGPAAPPDRPVTPGAQRPGL